MRRGDGDGIWNVNAPAIRASLRPISLLPSTTTAMPDCAACTSYISLTGRMHCTPLFPRPQSISHLQSFYSSSRHWYPLRTCLRARICTLEFLGWQCFRGVYDEHVDCRWRGNERTGLCLRHVPVVHKHREPCLRHVPVLVVHKRREPCLYKVHERVSGHGMRRVRSEVAEHGHALTRKPV